jgi:hypothetical protein
MEPTRRKWGRAGPSACGRMGLGTACKEETSWLKNVSFEISGREKNYVLDLRKIVYSQKNSFNNNTKFLACFC